MIFRKIQKQGRNKKMSRLGIFFADGCEGNRGTCGCRYHKKGKDGYYNDIRYREKKVTGSHQITFLTEALFEDVDFF